MSSAIHSEVVELVLSVENFYKTIDQSQTKLMELRRLVNKPLEIRAATASYIADIDKAIAKEKEITAELTRQNTILNDRRAIAQGFITSKESKKIDAQAGVALAQAPASAVAIRESNQAKLAIAAINAQIDLEKQLAGLQDAYSKAEIARTKLEADQIVAKYKLERDLEASNALSKETYDKQIADKRAENNRKRQADIRATADAEAAHQKMIMEFEARRNPNTGNFLANQARARGAMAASANPLSAKEELALAEQLVAMETRLATATATVVGLNGKELALLQAQVQTQAAATERANARKIVEQQTLAILKEQNIEAIKATTGYKVGSTLTNAKGSSVLSAGGMLSFGAGANSMGGMFYMAERLSNALNLGQKSLGEYAAKFGLVKLEGEGAEASIAAFGRGAMKLGGILALAAAPIAAMFAGNKLNVALAQMSTLMADASVTGEKFTAMLEAANGSAVKLSGAFGVNVVEVVEGFKLALSTGIDASQMERFTEIALTMGKGLGASLSQSISILTTFKDAFAGTVEDTVGYSDVLFNAINVGKFNIEQLNANIGRVAVTAAEAGVGFKDMMAALATLNRVGMSTSQAITALNQFIVSIVNPSDKAKKAMDGLGIAYGAAALKGKSLMAVVADIKAKIGSNNDLYGEIFSEERARRGAIGLAANPGLMATNTAEMEKQGTAAVAAARAMDTFSAQMGKIWSVISAIVQSVGSDLLNIAKDVFFPSGAMGKDTLAQIAIAMEGIGFVIKEIGIIIIGVTGTVWNLLKVLGSVGSAIGKFLTGDVSGAMDVVDRALTDLNKGMANAFEAMVTTIGTSADRVGQYMSKVGAETDDVADKVKGATDKVATMTDAFSSFADTTIGKTKGVIGKYDELIAKIDEAAKAARRTQAEFDFEAGYKKFDPNAEVNTSKSKEYKLFSMAAERVNSILATPGYDKQKLADAQKYLNEQEAIYVAWVEKERIATYEAEKAAAKLLTLKQKGLGPTDSSYPATSSPKDAEWAAGKLRELTLAQKQLMSETLPATSAMSDATLLARTDQLQAQLKELKFAADAVANTALDQATSESALTILAAERKEIETEIAKIKKEQATRDADSYEEGTKAFIAKWKLIFKEAVKKEEMYKKEYGAAVSLYNLKLKHFKAQEAALLTQLGIYREISEEAGEKSEDLKMAERGPDRARREYQDAIESKIKTVGSITNEREFKDESQRIFDLVEKFRSASNETGNERRGNIAAQGFYDAVKAISDARAAKTEQALGANKADQDKAHSKLITDTADNPVAIAARQYADDVVKETLGIAAKHGLSVSGDLVSHVEINGVEVNIPVEKLRDAVKQTVGVEMARIYADLIKRNPPPNANDRPPGDL